MDYMTLKVDFKHLPVQIRTPNVRLWDCITSLTNTI